MLEPKYDEDTVNLGYLKKVISDTEENIDDTYKNVSRHYASRPKPPYYQGDTWIDGDIVYTCINTRTIGLYQDTDWVTESGAKTEAERKNKTYLTQPSNYSAGDMWILQSDEDHRAGKKGEILISTAGRKEYDSDDWVNMLGYGTIKSINEVAGNLNNAINRIGNVEEAIQDGLIITFYQDTVPEGIHLGDLWYVTGELEGYTKGKIYRYDGINWVKLDDPAIQEAFDEANEARLVADGKIQSFYSEAEPTQNMGVGDLWIDLSNNNQLYRYNGTNWVAVYDTRINELVTTVETVTERVTTVETDLGEIDLKVKETTTTITTIEGNIDNIETLANKAQSTANSAVEGVNNITNTQGEAEGKSIHIEDSAEEPFVDVELYGESIQEGTPTPDSPSEIENVEGKNILDVKAMLDYWGATYTYNESTNSYNITNIGSGYANPYQFAREDILVSLSGDLSFEIATGVRLNLMNSNNESVSTFYDSSTKNENVLASKIRINYNAWNNGNATITDFMIEEGTVATPYVPYNSLEIKSVGENFLNVTAKTTTVQGLTFTVNEDKSITINGTNTGNTGTGTAFFRLADNFVLPAGDYTLSNKNANASGNSFLFYDDNYNFVTKNISNATFTKDTTIKPYIRVKAGATVNNQTIYPMILKGTYTEETMPAYKPYQEQKGTFPLGEEKLMEGSYLADDGIHHSRKQVVFDGTETNISSVGKVNNVYRYNVNISDIDLGYKKAICSHYKQTNDTYFGNINEECITSHPTIQQISFFTNFPTLDEFISFLATQYANGTPVIVEYDLAEPETVPYTEEQQEAWDKIKALMTYKNITNITSTAYAKVTYMRDNGLDVYETKQNAQKKYTETSEKLAEQKMTVDGVITQVSDITSKTDELTGEVKTINSEISTVKQTIEGWSSELKNTGGNNIFYYSLDFWDNSNGLEEYSDTEIMQNSISQTGYVLNNGSAKQTQSVKNGFYTCSFNYKKLLELAVCQVKINGTTYDLTETDWAEFEQAFEVKTNKIEIEFIGDTDNSLYISDLMVNVGTTKLSWSQNANETRTDTVTIGKGIQVNSSAKNTYHRIDADGNRTFNKATGKVVNEATDKGTETEELVVRGQAKIAGLLIQKVSDQVWINSLL